MSEEPKVYLAVHGQRPDQVRAENLITGPFFGITYDSLEHALNWQYRDRLSALYGLKDLPSDEVYQLGFATWGTIGDKVMPEWTDVKRDDKGNRDDLIRGDAKGIFIHVQIEKVLHRRR